MGWLGRPVNLLFGLLFVTFWPVLLLGRALLFPQPLRLLLFVILLPNLKPQWVEGRRF